MEVSVYLSNNNFTVATGTAKGKKIQITHVYSAITPEGSLINGVITNGEELSAFIKKFWDQNKLPQKNIRVVIDSSQFVTKHIPVPKMSEKQTLAYISKEFTEVDRAQDPIYSYDLISSDSKSKMNYVMATMVEREFIDSHIKLFAEAGINVTSVENAVTCAVKLLIQMPDVKNKTCIVMLADDSSVTNFLFVEGSYTYSGRNRVFASPGTPAFGSEIARLTSNLIQFMVAQKIEATLTDIYLGGVLPEDFSGCVENIFLISKNLKVCTFQKSNNVRLPADVDPSRLGDYIYIMGNLMMQKTSSSLFLQYRKNYQEIMRRQEIKRKSIPIVIWFLALAAVSCSVIYINQREQKTYHQLKEYLNSEALTEQLAAYDSVRLNNSRLSEGIDSAKIAEEYLSSYPKMNSSVQNVILNTAGIDINVRVTAYDASTGKLMLQATTMDVSSINLFADDLRNLDLFSLVDYRGYTKDKKEELYTIEVTCYLAENAGKQEVNQ